jgi:subtilisin family serine protease
VRALAAAISVAVALGAPAAASAYKPNDPLSPRQWYLSEDRVFDAFDVLPRLSQVRVAVLDSGVDQNHPELRGRIIDARSFVGGTPIDTDGHGTFVAGEIAAATGNGLGIAGLAPPPTRLLVAKIVRDDGTISPKAEARAIRWAVRYGARVINLSFGGTRDPLDPNLDGFSYAEQRAIGDAVRRGVLIVASVGNGDGAPTTPWPFASYPAALPHVLGVAAYARSGDVPSFSNRDDVFVDLAAPGQDILSLFPRALTLRYSSCPDQGYSSCGPKEYRHAGGTSFAAPQVSAAAAWLFALRPWLHADQVSNLLERSAADATPAGGCGACTAGRDDLTGFGRLDVAAAIGRLKGPLPRADSHEPNDDTGMRAAPVYRHAFRTRATLDAWDDPIDVYRVPLTRGERLSVRVPVGSGTDVSLVLWKPSALSLIDARDSQRAARSIHPAGVPERIRYRARASGWYYVQVKLVRAAFGGYTIRIARS